MYSGDASALGYIHWPIIKDMANLVDRSNQIYITDATQSCAKRYPIDDRDEFSDKLELTSFYQQFNNPHMQWTIVPKALTTKEILSHNEKMKHDIQQQINRLQKKITSVCTSYYRVYFKRK